MTMTFNLPALASLALLVACTGIAPIPIVSDYNGASVKVQTSQFADPALVGPMSLAEATRICKSGGKSRAEYASTISPAEYVDERLYLCL